MRGVIDRSNCSAESRKPLASVVEYLGADLDGDAREFVPTDELIEALEVKPTAFGRQMGDLGCRPRPGRITADDGTSRQARGYLIADIRAAVAALHDDAEPGDEKHPPRFHPAPPLDVKPGRDSRTADRS